MLDENTMMLDTTTEDVHHGISLILDAATTMYGPQDRELRGVETALAALLLRDGPSAEDVLARAFHRAGIFDEDQLRHAVDHAAMAFWNQLAACYSEIKTGDIDPETDSTLFGAMRSAARTWLQTNA